MNTDTIYDVLSCGAAGDGIAYDTHAIQNAIDECSRNGGGTVLFPAGFRFLTGTIYLRDNITLNIEPNAVILGSKDLEDYGRDTGRCPYYPEPLDYCLIYGRNLSNIRFTGTGTIDGQFREDFSEKHDDPLNTDYIQRPMLIRLEECTNIRMDNIALKGAFSWCIHLKYCEEIKLNSMNIYNDRQDGFNIESSQKIHISDCSLYCGDDGIALTTSNREKPLSDLTVTNCFISSRWAAVRFGPLSKGNFENITMSNCIFRDCGGGGIKIGMFEGAEIRDCIFSSIIMKNVTAPVFIMNAQWTDIGSADENPPLMPPGIIKDLIFSNLIIHSNAGPTLPWDRSEYTDEEIHDFLIRPDRNSTIYLHGHKDGEMRNIVFENLSMYQPGGGTASAKPFDKLVDIHEIDINSHGYWTDDKTVWGIPIASSFFIRHGSNIALSNIRISHLTEEDRPPIAAADSEKISLNRIRIDGKDLSDADIITNNGD